MSQLALPPPRARDWIIWAGYTLSLAGLLATGFLPTCHHFFSMLWSALGRPWPQWRWLGEMASFPLLAAVFAFSLRQPPPQIRESYAELARKSVLPLFIALCFGYLHPGSPGLRLIPGGGLAPEVWWYALFVPIGEELLFRGWLFALFEKLWPRRTASLTNPLPASVWLTSLAFSLWHLQNLARDPVPYVAFQCVYTLMTGLWLGYLRWKSGKLFPSILAHAAINALSLAA